MRLAIDLGGTHLRLGLQDGRRQWLHSSHQRRPDSMSAEQLVAITQSTIAAWGVGESKIAGIGISIAAVVDETGSILRAENLGWRQVPLKEIVSSVFRVPVEIDTDVFCGALFEARDGAAKGRGCALFVAVGTGIGHALIFDGHVWRGSAGRANGFGHIVVSRDGPACYCGLNGCVCQFASGVAQGRPDAPSAPIDALAQAVGAALTLVEPEIVVLNGGALSQNWFDFQIFAERVASFTYPGLALPEIVRSGVADANLRGAALLLETSS